LLLLLFLGFFGALYNNIICDVLPKSIGGICSNSPIGARLHFKTIFQQCFHVQMILSKSSNLLLKFFTFIQS